VKGFARTVVEQLVKLQPKAYTPNASKAGRKGKIYLDYLRNSKGANAIAAYSTRAKAGAPVSVPITWEELESGIQSDAFNVTNIMERLKKLRKEPWEGFDEVRQSITSEMKRRLG